VNIKALELSTRDKLDSVGLGIDLLLGHTKKTYPRGQYHPENNRIRILVPHKVDYTELDLKEVLAVLAHEVGHAEVVLGREPRKFLPPPGKVPTEIEASWRGLYWAREWGILPEFIEHQVKRVPLNYAEDVRRDIEGFFRSFME